MGIRFTVKSVVMYRNQITNEVDDMTVGAGDDSESACQLLKLELAFVFLGVQLEKTKSLVME